jgi:hypothetical protein
MDSCFSSDINRPQKLYHCDESEPLVVCDVAGSLDVSVMRLALLCAALAFVSATLAACDDLSSSHVLEVHCVRNTGFDDDKLCMRPERAGAELEIRVNANTQKVQILVVKMDIANWGKKDYILESCSVVDSKNWKCGETIGEPKGPFYMVRDYGMVRGQFYTSLTGGGGPDFYTSSVSGLTFWALHYGFITWPDALKVIGYPAALVAQLGKQE